MRIDETPGERIRRIRESKGMTETELGAWCDLSAKGIRSIEAGTIPIEIHTRYLKKVATALGESADYILYGDIHAEAETRREIWALREAGIIRDDDEMKELDKQALSAMKRTSDVRVPLSREALLVLLDLLRE